ncbi:MAG: RsmB/NOP family class I SAM-dependent RNA methyltransferase [Myxococcota bacterium]
MSAERFDAHYHEIFGERWMSLRTALLSVQVRIARLNAFHPASRDALPHAAQPIPELPSCFRVSELKPPDGPPPLAYYPMDAASVCAANALEVESGDRVLDACAAPGGKSLILAEGLGSDGTMVCNDSSSSRRARLRSVLELYLPAERRQQIRVTAYDGSRFGLHQPGHYDRVLVDVPCSSESHVLATPAALKAWTPARPRQLAIRQGALLASAIDATVSGGRVVYSTCALDPRENDGVVAKIAKKRRDVAQVVVPRSALGVRTEFGQQILPDQDGFGPIYFAVFEKRATSQNAP